MSSASAPARRREPFRIPLWFGTCVLLAIAAFFLWEEHRVHLFGALPYVLLFLCPIIHLFMHRGHGAQDVSSADDHHSARGGVAGRPHEAQFDRMTAPVARDSPRGLKSPR